MRVLCCWGGSGSWSLAVTWQVYGWGGLPSVAVFLLVLSPVVSSRIDPKTQSKRISQIKTRKEDKTYIGPKRRLRRLGPHATLGPGFVVCGRLQLLTAVRVVVGDEVVSVV